MPKNYFLTFLALYLFICYVFVKCKQTALAQWVSMVNKFCLCIFASYNELKHWVCTEFFSRPTSLKRQHRSLLIYGEWRDFFYQEQCLPICLQLSSHNFILILRLDNISCLIPFSRAAAFPSEVELILKQVSLINPMISCKCTFSTYVFVKATLFSPRGPNSWLHWRQNSIKT